MPIHQFIIPVCDDCLNLKGEMCHTPECGFCRRTMAEVSELLNTLLIRPIVDGRQLPVIGALTESEVAALRAEWEKLVEGCLTAD